MAISECMCYGIGGTCFCIKQTCCTDIVKGMRGWIYNIYEPEIYVGF